MDRRILIILCIAGSIGGIIGRMVLVNVAAGAIRPFVFGYLGIMGLVIIWRGLMFPAEQDGAGQVHRATRHGRRLSRRHRRRRLGPVVTSSLIGAGAPPRYVVGTVNAAEFVVTCAVVSAFAATIFLGVWAEVERHQATISRRSRAWSSAACPRPSSPDGC